MISVTIGIWLIMRIANRNNAPCVIYVTTSFTIIGGLFITIFHDASPLGTHVRSHAYIGRQGSKGCKTMILNENE